MGLTQKLVGTGALWLLTIALGLWLSHSGRPLNAALSAVHKLVSLAAAVVSGFVFLGNNGGARVSPLILVVLGACVVALIATGAVLSGTKQSNRALLMHNIATVLAVLCLISAFFLRTPPWGCIIP